MMKNYFFLAPSLPAISLDEKPEISFKELMRRLELNLDKEGMEQVAVLRRVFDLENIRALYSGQPLSTLGNLNEKELDEALLVKADLPEYVFHFLDQFEENEEKVRHFFGLLGEYYREEAKEHKGFLKDLLEWQRSLRLVLLALRSKRAKLDVVEQLQFEDPLDPLVAQIIAQKDADSYDPPMEFAKLKEQLHACANDPMQMHRTVLDYEFNQIEEMAGYPLFSLEWILGYVARLLVADRLFNLNPELGNTIIENYKTGT